jgi:predicted AlkP superfamily phosphohydrolase/phosphomutase
MPRVLILGIDGMDKELIEEFKNDLPNLRKIQSLSPKVNLTSTFPPDSETAWSSIYTGLNPAKHGVVHFIDPLEKSLLNQTKDADSESIRGHTFWDKASDGGKRVCVILPHIGYPIWPVNGIMIGRSSVEDDVQVWPENILNNSDINKLNTIKGFPGFGGISHHEFIQKHKDLLETTLKVGLTYYEKEAWDIFFIYSSILDVVPHFFWKYHDTEDPDYIDGNPFNSVIKDLYVLHDNFIAQFLNRIDDETVLIVVSDHGHGRRPTKIVNVNEILRQQGFLIGAENKAVPNLFETFKGRAVNLISNYNLENVASRLLQRLPSVKKLCISSPSIDWSLTRAYVTDLSGIKSYPYGGININRDIIKDDSTYEQTCEDIIGLLPTEISKYLGSSDPALLWIKKREEIYDGPFIDKYPDIVFELNEEYGIGNNIKCNVVEKNALHAVVPGSHKRYNAVLLMYNLNRSIVKTDVSLDDLAPTILSIIDLDYDDSIFDGHNIIAK